MTVLSGTATIPFGVADLDIDLDKSNWGGAKEDGGIEITAKAGDVFIIPAGSAHETYDTSPGAAFNLLTQGEDRGIQAEDVGDAFPKVQSSGFTMMGAYPINCSEWDFSLGGEDVGNFEACWSVPKPEIDAFLGSDVQSLCRR